MARNDILNIDELILMYNAIDWIEWRSLVKACKKTGIAL